MIHLYCGEGKGKTTAAMGLALRAAGQGLPVVIVQFLKGRVSGEISLLQNLPGVQVLRGKNSLKFSFQMDEGEKKLAKQAHEENLAEALRLTKQNPGGLLVLDEALGALSAGLLCEDTVTSLLAECPKETELVFTGRNPAPFLLERADYITEMKNIRHPFEKGTAARKGIEY